MDSSTVIVMIGLLALVLAVVVLVGAYLVTDRARTRLEEERASLSAGTSVESQVTDAMRQALLEVRAESADDQRRLLTSAMQQMLALNKEQVGAAVVEARQSTSAELGAKKDVIDTKLSEVHREMRSELDRLSTTVAKFAEASAQRFGEVDQSLRSQAKIASTLAESTEALRSAMASPTARGQWGERMAEDVLRVAGFVENVNFTKQTQIEGATGRPDFTFHMPKGNQVYMDVKFPMRSYLDYLSANSDIERDAHRSQFLKAVRGHVRTLAKRDYARESHHQSVDYVLMFLPNESLTSFIFENDPSVIDDAMAERVVLCSPLTLFALLGVIRQAHDNFMIEQTSDEILGLIAKFGQQWTKYNDELEKVQNSFDRLGKQFDTVMSTRRRALERPLSQLESIRRERNLPIDGEMFAELESADETPPNIRRLGA